MEVRIGNWRKTLLILHALSTANILFIRLHFMKMETRVRKIGNPLLTNVCVRTDATITQCFFLIFRTLIKVRKYRANKYFSGDSILLPSLSFAFPPSHSKGSIQASRPCEEIGASGEGSQWCTIRLSILIQNIVFLWSIFHYLWLSIHIRLFQIYFAALRDQWKWNETNGLEWTNQRIISYRDLISSSVSENGIKTDFKWYIFAWHANHIVEVYLSFIVEVYLPFHSRGLFTVLFE